MNVLQFFLQIVDLSSQFVIDGPLLLQFIIFLYVACWNIPILVLLIFVVCA